MLRLHLKGLKMPSEPIRVRCDECENVVAFPATLAGTTQECPECRAYVDVPDSSTEFYDPNREVQKYENQVYEVDRQQEIARRQLEQYQRQLDEWETVLQRKKQETEQMFAMIERWNSLAERFEKLLT